MKNYLQRGGTVTVTAPANVSPGDVVVVGALVGVAAFDASQNDEVEITTEGVFTLPKRAPTWWPWATCCIGMARTTT